MSFTPYRDRTSSGRAYNPVGAWFLAWQHDWGHVSIDSVCWKCKQARICFSATDSKLFVCKTKVSVEGVVTDVACFDDVQ